ncbi:MAG: hypothetical protein JXA96_11625 [Sedimentisphaerales bacterium]|nr:hypothetical protein [Sedimentisphaerales bacterium]
MKAVKSYRFIFRIMLTAIFLSTWANCLCLAADDPYENNDSMISAYSLPQMTWLSEINGWAVQSDDDWYKIQVSSQKPILLFEVHWTDTISLRLYDSTGTSILYASRGGRYDTVTGGTFYLRVTGYDEGASYDLAWNSISGDDSYEPASGQPSSTRYDLTGYENQWLSTINGPGIFADWDQYSYTAPRTGTIEIECLFTHREGNIDMLVGRYEPQITSSTTLTDNERVIFNVEEGASYWILICDDFEYGGVLGNQYDLCWRYVEEDIKDYDLYDVGESYRSFAPQTLRAGQTLDMYFSLGNNGTESTSPCSIEFYASVDTSISSSDYKLGHTGTLPSIAGGDSLACHAAEGSSFRYSPRKLLCRLDYRY